MRISTRSIALLVTTFLGVSISAFPQDRNSAMKEKLKDAITSGDVNTLQGCIAGGISPDTKVDYPNIGAAPLIWIAAQRNQLGICKLLLNYGADPNAHANFGESAIFLAIVNGNEDLVRILIGSGANVNAENSNSVTPIFYAAKYGNPTVMDLLQESGAKIRHKDKRGNTILHFAVRGGHIETADWALRYFSPFAPRNIENLSPILTSVLEDDVLMFEHLLSHDEDTKMRDTVVRESFICANKNDKGEIIRALITNHVSKSALPGETFGGLFEAADKGSLRAMSAMIECGVDIDTPSAPSKWTAMHFAVSNSRYNMATLLLRLGADVGSRDANGRTPLHVATIQNKARLAKLLLNSGADVNSPDIYGRYPIYYAVVSDNWNITKTLIENGANSKYDTKGIEEIGQLAKRLDKANILTNLKHKPPSPLAKLKQNLDLDPMFRAVVHIRSNANEDFDAVIDDDDLDVKTVRYDGWLLIHYAADSGNLYALKKLIDIGVDVNATTKWENWTPLHFVVSRSDVDGTKLLLENGAKVSIADANGVTPSMVNDMFGNVEIGSMLK
jgi:ankyrin repeat protein